MTLRLNGSTSGYVELDCPAAGGNNTLVLPSVNGSSGQALQTTGSGVLEWGVGVSNDAQLCKAWVNFNGTGTVAIRGSYNVSSITDNNVGDYTVNFTTALSSANYAVAQAVAISNTVTTSDGAFSFAPKTLATGSFSLISNRGTGAATDAFIVSACVYL